MKVQITLDDELMKRLDEYADQNYMTRSGLISFAVTQFLNSAEVTRAVIDMSLSIRKIADTGVLDEATKKELADYERICNLLVGKGR